VLLKPTSLPEVIVITLQVYEDQRGFFMETFHAQKFGAADLPFIFVQDNHAGSIRNTLRGMHYQLHQPQGKLVRVLVGEIYDVAIDLRRWSSNFGRWMGIELSAASKLSLWVPPGFAHGYFVLSEWAEVAYKTTDYYAPEWERTLLWSDPALGITWPLPTGQEPLLSPRDRDAVPLAKAEVYEREIK
jgi:dTDP-4-dehydrorhamnose 3,5-epimerase